MVVSQIKQLPNNIEAEQSVLGAMFISKQAIDKSKEVLGDTDFYLDSHQKIYEVIIDLVNNHVPIDITTVTAELDKRKILPEVGGVQYLSQLSNSVPTAANIDYYIKIVEEKSLLRRLIDTATSIATDGYQSLNTIEEVLDDAEKNILQVVRNRRSTEFKTITEVLVKARADLEKLSQTAGSITGLRTGFPDLDSITAGLQPNDLIILAARPGMGKTAFALNLATNAAKNSNASVAIFNLEMSAEQLAMRMISSMGRIEGSKMRNGRLDKSDWEGVSEAISQLSSMNIYIDDTPGIRVGEIRAKSRRLAGTEKGLDLVIIDYLQLISGSGKHGGNRQQEVSEISRALKTLALELNIPVIALSQLSRAVESREDKRPNLSDLRESGSIEQDADIVGFLYRDDYYSKEATDQNQASKIELLLRKHRSGPTGNVEMLFFKNNSMFAPISNRNEGTY